MKILKFLASIIIIILIVVSVGGYLFLKNFDLNKYKPLIAAQVEKQIGRKLEIGNAQAKLSLIPTVVVEDVTLSNASWAKEPYMVVAKKVEIEIAILPLLNKEIHVRKLILDQPNVYLQTNTSGVGNWVFDMPQKHSYKFEIISSAHAEDAKIEIPNISLKNIAINNGLVVFNQDNIGINSFNLNIPSKNDNIDADFDITYNNEHIKGQTTTGSIDTLLEGQQPFSVVLNAVAMKVKLAFNGNVLNALNNPVVAGDINVYNPAGNFNAPETTLDANINASKTSVTADIKSLNVASNLIVGKVHVNLQGKPNINANISSNLINLQTLQSNKPLAFELPSFISSANATALVPATPIDYSALKQINAIADISIKTLIINPDFTANNVLLKANLNNGVLSLNPTKFDFGNGEIDANAVLNANTQSLALNLRSKNLLIQNLLKEFTVTNPKDFGIIEGGNLDLEANLTSKGNTLKALVEGLDGRVIAIVNKSLVQTGDSKWSAGLLGSIIDAIGYRQKAKRNTMELTCAVIRGDFENGKLTLPKGIAIQSNELTLVADGKINLQNDKIDISIRPFSGKVVDTNIASALANFIKVKGTIDHPQMVLDEKEAVRAIVGVVTTGGAYVGEKMILDADSSPCYTALAGTGLENQFPKPAKTQQLYQEGTQKIDNSVKKLEGAAKGLLRGLLKQ